MKNDLTCGVVRDLLPSYVENLLGEESREAVDRHLAGCPECTARKEAMTAPAGQAEETAKEVDFLKGVKKRSGKRVALAVLCTVVVLVGAFLVKEFVIGRAVDPESISIQCAEVDEQGSLTFLADTYWGAYELRGLRSTEEDGIIRYTAREVRMNAFQFMGEEAYRKQIPLTVSLKNVTEVWFCGRLVWQDGMVITQECLDLLALRTPYCGDAPAMGKIAQAMLLQERLGGYTTELQTSKRPYRWTLDFENMLSQNQLNYMIRCEYLILALVDNLESVVIRESCAENEEGPGLERQEMPLASASRALCTGWDGSDNLTEQYNKAHGTSWTAKTSVKDYVRSPADFQRLLNILDYHFLELRDFVLE